MCYWSPEPLLSRCVPKLKLQSLSINFNNLGIKLIKREKEETSEHYCKFGMMDNSFLLTFSLKSNPIVASECKGNLPAQNLNERHVFPTPLSPRTIILKLLSFFCEEGGVWWRGRLLGPFCSDVFLLSVSSKSALDILVSWVTRLVIIWRYLSGKYLHKTTKEVMIGKYHIFVE